METKQHGTKKINESVMKSKWKLKISLETNDNGNTPIQKLWGATCVVLRGKFSRYRPFSKTRNLSNKPPKPPHKKDLGKEEENKT